MKNEETVLQRRRRDIFVELSDHPFFIASQFHPEFLSKPHQPHPLFKGFIAAAHAHIYQKPL